MHNKIKNYLKENGIKQTFLAEKVGVPDSAMSDMLAGDRKIDVIEYYKICTALNVPLDFFFKKQEAAHGQELRQARAGD